LVFGAGGFFAYNRYITLKPNAANFIDKIREENKAGFDSLQNAINYENDLNCRIEKSIYTGDFNTAYTLMDSLPTFGKTNSMHLYKGMIYAEQKKYPEAIEEYNIVIEAEPFPFALDKRAKAYIKTNKLDFALHDYKKAYLLNYDYSIQVATTFELINKKDSALKYYQIFLGHYPNDTAVQQKTKNLLYN
jgi:tetratricopeptide (TPR) repeat protein